MIRIADSHTDFLTSMSAHEREKYVERCVNAGVEMLICAVFTTEHNFNIKDIELFNEEIKYLSEKYNIRLLLSIEDCAFIKDEVCLYKLIDLKPFSVTLTWNAKNQFAGGSKTDLGLTGLGRETVTMLEASGIIVDTAHMSERSFYDFVSTTALPIFNSHSNIDSINPHVRNLKDEQISLIVNTGGYMGLTLYDEFISGNAINGNAVVKQLEYLIDNFSFDCFGLGTDLYGVDENHLPIDMKCYDELHKLADELIEKYNMDISAKIMSKNLVAFVDKMCKTRELNKLFLKT